MQDRPLLTMSGFTLVWVLAAAIADNTTFHLAPVIVAAVPAMLWRDRRLIGFLVGVGGTVIIAALLALSGLLGGPSLLPFGGAMVESVVGAFVGGMVGVAANSLAGHSIAPDRRRATPIG